MKKVIAAVLAATTMASLVSISAFAAPVTADYTNLYTDTNTTKAYGDTVTPDSSIYIRLNETTGTALTAATAGSALSDGDKFKVKFDKGNNNPKMISKISLVEKDDAGVAGTNREWWIKIEIKDDYTGTEFKLTPDITFTAKEKLDAAGVKTDVAAPVIPVDYQIGFYPTIFVQNSTKSADYVTANGTGGIVIKPTKDDTNEIIWEDQNEEVARLTFMGDSDTGKFFPKLSTKWNNDEYQALFANQNAFKFEFVATPTISSTSRATLELYNPYVNEDGDPVVDPETITIYSAQDDGTLLDVSADFVYGTNDNDNLVFATQTRTLGYYIMAETPIEEEVTDEEMPLDETEITIDNEKLPPNTGSF